MPMNGGSTTVLAGSGSYGFADGQGTAAVFYSANGFVIHPVTGVMYITDADNNRIRTCTLSGNVGTLTGTGTPATYVGNIDGSSSVATFWYPYGIIMDSTSSYLYVSCYFSKNLRKVEIHTVTTTTIIGSRTFRNPGYVIDDFHIWSN